MRISDWSSDVCSSDLDGGEATMRRTSKSDPHRRLLRALLEMAGPETEPIGSSSRSWASVTFTGAQHEFELFLMGKDAHDRANKLADRKSVVKGKSVEVRVDLGVRRIIKKKKNK